MNKLLVICGLTATGKTSLAIKMAKEFDGEIISADSRQVYVGMNLGTGKDVQGGKWYFSGLEWGMGITEGTEKKQKAQKIGYWEVNGVPIWLLDVVKPNQEFSVAQYVDLAWKVIHNIWKKKKLPIIVGGTGFYIKTVVDGVATKDIPPNPKIRQGMKDWNANQLYQYLESLDPIKAASLNKSDRQNPRRLIRAIEIAAFKKENPGWEPEKHKRPLVLFIGLKADYKKLYQRIDERVLQRVKMGAEKEVRALIKKGYTWDLPAMNSMGYIQWKPFFEGKLTRGEAIRRWKFAEHAYARRQMTWFKKALRQAQGHWFDITKKGWKDEVEKLISSWYTEKRYGQKN